MTRLKPCPFCGSEAVYMPGVVGYQIGCIWANEEDSLMAADHCPLAPLTWNYKTKAEAIAAWNRRAACAAKRRGK